MHDTFFFFRISDNKPECFPVIGQTKRLTLDGVEYLLIPLPNPKYKDKESQPKVKPVKQRTTEKSYPKERVAEYLIEAGSEGLHPLKLKELLADVWPVALGPILAQLAREKIAHKLSDGKWAAT